MIDVSHLLDPDAVPDDLPQRTDELMPRVYGGAGTSVTQTRGEVSVGIEQTWAQEEHGEAIESTAPVDRFMYLDFRVSYTNNVVSIRTGRVYYTYYGDIIQKFAPARFTVPAATLPLTLVDGDEYASVWLSLPREINGFGMETSIRRYFAKPTGYIKYETRWEGYAGAGRYTGFAVATNDLAPTPVRPTDFMIPLADISFSAGVRHIHFGSVFIPTSFDGELTHI